jgi:hypothetical protein
MKTLFNLTDKDGTRYEIYNARKGFSIVVIRITSPTDYSLDSISALTTPLNMKTLKMR